MTQPDQPEPAVDVVESEAFVEVPESDVDRARRWLSEAERQLVASYGRNFPSVALATAAAVVGGGYAQLAAAEVITATPEPLVLRHHGPVPAGYAEGLERAMRAIEEAPADDVPAEPAPAPTPVAVKATAKPRRSTRG